MINHLIYGIGAFILSFGCINSQFKKSILNSLLEFTGFILMLGAYLI